MKIATLIIRNIDLDVQYEESEEENTIDFTIMGAYIGKIDVVELIENNDEIITEIKESLLEIYQPLMEIEE